MAKIILQAINMAPRFLWQIYARPAMVYDFVMKGKDQDNKENIFIATLAVFFSGLLVGMVLAIPHYFLYQDLWRGLVFALGFGAAFSFAFAFVVVFAVAFAGAFAFAGAGAVAFAVAILGAFAFAGAFAGAGVFVGVFAFAVAFVSVFAVAFAGEATAFIKLVRSFIAQPSVKLILVLICILFLILVYLVFKGKIKIKSGHTFVPILFAISAAFLLLAGEGGG